MARVTAAKARETKISLLKAAREVLLAEGYAGLTTRAVAAIAATPMSQIQYHFGSKDGMILALFEYMNDQLLERQNAMYNDSNLKLSQQWDMACDYLDEDLKSGYVRVLHELQAAGMANTEVGRVVIDGLLGWNKILTDVASKAGETHGSLGPFTPEDISALVASAFLGAEAQILLGMEDRGAPLRRALRRVGDIIRMFEDSEFEGAS